MSNNDEFKRLVDERVSHYRDALLARMAKEKKVLFDYADGMSLNEIREKHDISNMSLYRLLKGYQLPRRYSVKSDQQRSREKHAKENYAKHVEDFVKKRLSAVTKTHSHKRHKAKPRYDNFQALNDNEKKQILWQKTIETLQSEGLNKQDLDSPATRYAPKEYTKKTNDNI